MDGRDPILIVYPSRGSAFHETFARRLAAAADEGLRGALVRSSAEVSEMDEEQLAGATLGIVSPWECAQFVGNRERFFARLSAAKKRITVLAEAVEIKWFSWQFRLPIRYDALIDVGFASQKHKLPPSFDLPYHFLFNGPTREEERTIKAASTSSKRPIPWAFVGHIREDRARLASELVEELDPGGFVFLPTAGAGVRKGKGMISPSSLANVLSKTRYYVWRSHHEFAYYESFRFIEAILAGAVPCKVDVGGTWKQPGIPNVFPSVQALRRCIESEGFPSMLGAAREFYLSRGRLADHLEEALGVV
jgi:hypothetical protein